MAVDTAHIYWANSGTTSFPGTTIGRANDKLYGQKGNDKLSGKAGNDTLKGGPSKDTLKGGAGKDKQVQ